MNLRPALPLVAALLLSSRVASPGDVPEAGAPRETLPLLGPLPEAKSPPPTLAEWTAALDIGGLGMPRACTLRRVREWIRFRCTGDKLLGPELLAGTASEVFFSNVSDECPPVPEAEQNYWLPRDHPMTCNARIEIVFALRRGDRRLFQIVQQGIDEVNNGGEHHQTMAVAYFLSAFWVAGEPLPEVVAR